MSDLIDVIHYEGYAIAADMDGVRVSYDPWRVTCDLCRKALIAIEVNVDPPTVEDEEIENAGGTA